MQINLYERRYQITFFLNENLKKKLQTAKRFLVQRCLLLDEQFLISLAHQPFDGGQAASDRRQKQYHKIENEQTQPINEKCVANHLNEKKNKAEKLTPLKQKVRLLINNIINYK